MPELGDHVIRTLRHVLDGRLDLGERVFQLDDGSRAALDGLAAGLHGGDGRLRVLLDARDEVRDLLGRCLAGLGELADLVGDDGETAAMLACARGLDGGVQREEVRLLGDARNGLDNRADLLRALAELVDGLRAALDDGLDALDVVDGVHDALAALNSAAVRRARVALDGIGRRMQAVDGRDRLADAFLRIRDVLLLLGRRLRRIRDAVRDLLRRLRALVRARRELLRRRCELLRRLVRRLHEAGNRAAHVGEVMQHLAELVAALRLIACLAEIAVAHLAAGADDDRERLRDFLRRDEAHRDEDDEHDNDHDDDVADGRGRVSIRLRLEVDGALMLHLPELCKVRTERAALLRAGRRIRRERLVILAGHRLLHRLVERRMEILPVALDSLHQGICLWILDGDGIISRDAVVHHLDARLIFPFEVLQALRIVAARRHDDRHALRIAHACHRITDVIEALHARLVHRIDVFLRRPKAHVTGDARAEQAHNGDDAEQEQLVGDLHVIHPSHITIPFPKILPNNAFP